MLHPEFTREKVKDMLKNYAKYTWSVQGFGFIRTYLTKDRTLRLHIWDSAFRVEDVSDIHTHPWDFVSYVYSGVVHNSRYRENRKVRPNFIRQRIKAGEDAHKVGHSVDVYLETINSETIYPGGHYCQKHDEIHRSTPIPGTVTLVEREFISKDVDHADVYYPTRTPWVDAKPGDIHLDDIEVIIKNALNKWVD